MFLSYPTMNSYTEAKVQAIFPYWDFPNWTTEPNAKMVKDLSRKCYANGTVVSATLGGGEHVMLGKIIPFTLYVVSVNIMYSIEYILGHRKIRCLRCQKLGQNVIFPLIFWFQIYFNLSLQFVFVHFNLDICYILMIYRSF